MKPFTAWRKKQQARQGYIMVWLVLIFSCMAITSLIIFSSAQSATLSTKNQHNQQQAYYTAKSACLASSQYVVDHVNDEAIMNQLTAIQGTGSYSDMGSYTVDVSYVTTDRIKIMATADYDGATACVSAYLITLPRPSGIIPTDNALYINGSGATGIGQFQIFDGDMYVDGDLRISEGTTIRGSIIVDGVLDVSGGSLTTDSVFCFSSVFLRAGGSIGALTCEGDLTMSGGASVNGDAYVQGSLSSTGSGTVFGNAIVKNNVTFSGGSNKIRGTLFYGGSSSVAWGTLNSFAPSNVHTGSYTAIDDSAYVSQELPEIILPAASKNPDLYKTVTITDNTISSSGTLTSAVLSTINATYGKTITVDCTKDDVFLLVDNFDFNLSRGGKILIKTDAAGKHNCYIFLRGANAKITMSANTYMGNPTATDTPHLYIIGYDQSMSMVSNSTVNAVVYLPYGKLSALGSCNYSYSSLYKLLGCAIVKEVNVDNDVKFLYVPPDIDDTPLDIFGSNAQGKTAWKIESWGVN